MKRKFNVALAQMAPKDGEMDYNLKRALEKIDEAAELGVDIIVFPELYYSGYNGNRQEIRKYAEPQDGYLFSVLSEKAKEKKMHILMGYPEKNPHTNRCYISLMFIDDNGKLIGNHRKTFRWTSDFGRVSPGDGFPVIDTKFGKIGLLLCYEIEAPEPGRILALKGAELIITASAFTMPEIHERDLMAIAIQNLVYVAGVNNATEDYKGNSAFIDPYGETLCRASVDKEELLIQTIDLDKDRKDIYPAFDDFVNEFSRLALERYTEAINNLHK